MNKAWVIGGTSGIGKACVERLRDHAVVVSTGHEEFDVRSSQNQWRWMIRDLQYPTHIVYSAGVNHLDWLGDGATPKHMEVVDINLIGFISLVDAMVEVGWDGGDHKHRGYYPGGVMPRIVAISSDAAERPLRTSIGYCASKAGLNMAVRVAARELGRHGWRINAVAPGMTAPTGMSEYIDKRVPEIRGWSSLQAMDYEESQEVVPGRITPAEVAEVVYSTITGPDHLNGSIITINGGR